jgi:Pectate lyase superfamily protein
MTAWTPIDPSAASFGVSLSATLLDVRDYGATGDGVTDDASALNDALAAIVNGGTLVIPPGTYLCRSQITLTKAGTQPRACIYGYGAVIKTEGAISGLKLTRGSTWGGISVYGLTVNHRGNADATYGFEIMKTWDCKLYDCTVVGHGTQADYAAFICRSEDPSDPDTGCFWTSFINCKARRQGGGDGTKMARGIYLRGAANATDIIACNIGDVTTCVEVKPETGYTYAANAVLILGSWFEGYTTAIIADNLVAGTTGPSGLRVIGCRFESGTTVFDWCATSTTQPPVAPYLAGNFFVSNAGTYIVNPNSIYYTSLDMCLTPSINPSFKADLTIESTSGSTHPLTVETIGGNRGIAVAKSDGTVVVNLLWTGSDNGGEVKGSTTDTLHLGGVKGISNHGTVKAQNLRGTKTFQSSAAAAVTFATAEADASYYLTLSGSAGETFWVSSKATTGFTLNSSNATSTAVVDWHLIR